MKKDFVSVVLPTCNRYEAVLRNIANIAIQKYRGFEILVCDDSDKANFEKNTSFIESLNKYKNIKYFYTARFDHNGVKDYGLARARNTGVIEAEGEYIVFFDDRITPASDNVLSTFVSHIRSHKGEKVWLFGDKGAQKTAFVENFSIIKKSHIVDAGMFCERIDKYGGMSRELIARYHRQGFKLIYTPEALAKEVTKSDGWDKKTPEIVEMKLLLKKLHDR